MAAKLILSMDGMTLKDYPLNKERVTVGRKSSNDVVIENLAVSGEHAVIVTILHDSFLEDLDSTNGLVVNGVATKKHFLHNNDVIEIGKHTLRYVTDQVTQTSAADFEKTMVMRAPAAPIAPAQEAIESAQIHTQTERHMAQHVEPVQRMVENVAAAAMQTVVHAAPIVQAVAVTPPPPPAVRSAVVQILTGPNAGKELELIKNLTTLGKPGMQVAVLARRPHGFFITHVEGATFPLVNGHPLNDQPHPLNDHDLIDLAGVKMEFYFKN